MERYLRNERNILNRKNPSSYLSCIRLMQVYLYKNYIFYYLQKVEKAKSKTLEDHYLKNRN